MNQRVLFVDDDRSLLNMLERNFSLELDVSTAESGPEALQLILDSEPFAVTMVDMRMPEMHGVELIQRAREFAPDSTYIMLTGNQDVNTAMQAVNDGQVFRFLNKPCEIAEIRRAIEAGMQQHDFMTGQIELLNDTFTGAVGVLSEIVESMEKTVISADAIKSIAEDLTQQLNIETNWATPWTARFLVVGLPLLTDAQRQELIQQPIASTPHIKSVRQLIEMSASLIRRIPRLDAVTDVLDAASTVDGSFTVGDDGSKPLATALMLAFYTDLLRRRGTADPSILPELRMRFSALSEPAHEVLAEMLGCTATEEGDESVERKGLLPSQLEEGMVVAVDVTNGENVLLVAEGRRLTAAMIERLEQLSSAAEIKIEVLVPRGTDPEEEPENSDGSRGVSETSDTIPANDAEPPDEASSVSGAQASDA